MGGWVGGYSNESQRNSVVGCVLDLCGSDADGRIIEKGGDSCRVATHKSSNCLARVK